MAKKTAKAKSVLHQQVSNQTLLIILFLCITTIALILMFYNKTSLFARADTPGTCAQITSPGSQALRQACTELGGSVSWHQISYAKNGQNFCVQAPKCNPPTSIVNQGKEAVKEFVDDVKARQQEILADLRANQ